MTNTFDESSSQHQLSLLDERAERPSSRTAKPRVRAVHESSAPQLPPHDHFPYNDPQSRMTVGSLVLKESRQPLIITGYTSLPMVIDLLAHYLAHNHNTQDCD